MRRAHPDALSEDATPGVVLDLSELRLRELFPVRFSRMDALSEPEPSKGALVRLNSGLHVVVAYGTITHRATLSFPVSADLRQAIRTVFDEVRIRPSEIVWVAESGVKTAAR